MAARKCLSTDAGKLGCDFHGTLVDNTQLTQQTIMQRKMGVGKMLGTSKRKLGSVLRGRKTQRRPNTVVTRDVKLNKCDSWARGIRKRA